jgi:hypothetical protein
MVYPRIATAFVLAAALPHVARADEGAISFWLPGLYGSFAATPAQPGWSFATLYYHASVEAGADQAFPRGGKGRISLGIEGRGNIVAFGPTYIFTTPLLGAQLSLSLLGVGGRNQGTVDATLTGPNGNTISGSRTEALTASGDVLPQASLKWNDGVNNYLAYVTGDIPVGAYDPDRLANLGIRHGAIDAGGGYTYFNPATGREASAVLLLPADHWRQWRRRHARRLQVACRRHRPAGRLPVSDRRQAAGSRQRQGLLGVRGAE